MVTKYKLYLFDLDGTLLDSDEMLRVTFHQLYKLYKSPDYIIDDTKIQSFSGPQITETLTKEFPDQDLNFMLGEWEKYSQPNYLKYTKNYPGVKALFEKMSRKNILFSIITNKHRYATDSALKLMKLDGFDFFSVCADEVKNLKPAPDGIFKAMEHFGITNKKDVIYIGDSMYDYLTARNAGIDFGYVSWSPRKLDEDSKIDLLIDDFEKFAEEL